MGASEFTAGSHGRTAQEAFRLAVEDAQFEYGHAGYTGSIAEKDKFTIIDVPAGKEPRKFAEELMAAGDPRVDDKWGPAGAVRDPSKDKDGLEYWLFFGWASE
jgi:hypothetical protein